MSPPGLDHAQAQIGPGDTLFIPPLYLHEVQTTFGGGSLGVNTFHEAFEFSDAVCSKAHSTHCAQCSVHPMGVRSCFDCSTLTHWWRRRAGRVHADQAAAPVHVDRGVAG